MWEYFNDLLPLDVTTTTDIAADWKLSGYCGGVKESKMLCTLCPCSSGGIHLPSENHFGRFCNDKLNDWHLCGDVKEDLIA